MEFDYGFEYAFPDAMETVAEGALGAIFGVILLFWLLLLAFGVVSYVLSAVGMYRIAKRRGIHHPWLAWIPVGDAWLLGSISDHYQYVAKQKVTNRRKVLLILNIISLAFSILFAIAGTFLGVMAESAIFETDGIFLTVGLMLFAYLALMGITIANLVFCYIAYFDLFRSSKPKYDVLFLVLGIFFTVTLPFFVFACGNSDEGMPARRSPQPPVQIPCAPEEVTPEPVEEEIPVVEAEIVEDPE